ncbi:mitochondrial import inner membrane translocase subunit PAM16 like 2-like [Asparagus officinalis]|uniref:mitochondrial import inner membrane translocase subunit PAM16 like 2-like n=1 Tax=Asparagus officinalis TaxID=4686 RepID=UPI00098DFA4B|nr:mitochondrial import inner membrane translocase subunit PAM16 like 2-like [Asparagus officinalis]
MRDSSSSFGFDLRDLQKKIEIERVAKFLANLIIMGSGILGRAVFQAYRKALENASKNGVSHEAINCCAQRKNIMTEQEASHILGLSEQASWEEVLRKYDALFERNAKNGSFYLQSKVHRAKEALESVYRGDSTGTS